MTDETNDKTNETNDKIQDRSMLLKYTTNIVSGYLAHNRLSPQELIEVIKQVHDTLSEIERASLSANAEKPVPAVDPKKSVHNDYIICLEDGAKLKSLKRYLITKYKMTPEQYRAKWGLPRDYPMVCRSYSKMRSEMAKKIGLGQGKTANQEKEKEAAD